jgi:hypothetical protein
MGYTHYWESYAKRIPAEAVDIIKEIVEKAYAAGVVQYEHDDPKPPVVTDTRIRFNGVGEGGHETFYFDVNDDYRASSGAPFAFCKTARKPYDDVVMRVLIVLKYYLKDDIQVSSDGQFDAEWQSARDEMAKEYGIATYVSESLVV